MPFFNWLTMVLSKIWPSYYFVNMFSLHQQLLYICTFIGPVNEEQLRLEVEALF